MNSSESRASISESFQAYNHPQLYDAAFGRSYARELDLFHRLFRRYTIPASGRIVDLGSGTGRFTIQLARMGYECLGIDNNPRMVAFARELAKGLPNAPRFLLGDISTFRVEMPVDACLCLGGTLHHLVDSQPLRRHFRNACRNLKTGGLYILELLITHPEDEPVEIEQEWRIVDADRDVTVSFTFPPCLCDVQSRKRWAVLEIRTSAGLKQSVIHNRHWFRIFFEHEFYELARDNGFVFCAWYSPATSLRRSIVRPASHPSVYAVLRRK